MVSVNQKLFDLAFVHSTTLDRFTEGEIRKILRFMNQDVFPDLIDETEKHLKRIKRRGINSGVYQTKRYAEMIQSQRAFLTQSFSRYRSILAADMRKLGKVEVQFQNQMFHRAMPVEFTMTLPDPQLLRSIVTARPMQGRLLKDWSQSLDQSTRRGVQSQINIGLAQGDSVPKIVRRLRGTKAGQFKDGVLQISRRNAESIARTSISHTITHSRSALYAGNKDIVKGEYYSAVLDTGTTDICISLDGREFKIGEGEYPPMHMRCRSERLPLLKSFAEIGIPNKKEIPRTTRESMDGQVPAKQTYGDWLKNQSKARQVEVLGKQRAKWFRDGDLNVRDLTDNSSRPLTLKQLRKKLFTAT